MKKVCMYTLFALFCLAAVPTTAQSTRTAVEDLLQEVFSRKQQEGDVGVSRKKTESKTQTRQEEARTSRQGQSPSRRSGGAYENRQERQERGGYEERQGRNRQGGYEGQGRDRQERGGSRWGGNKDNCGKNGGGAYRGQHKAKSGKSKSGTCNCQHPGKHKGHHKG